MADVAHRPPPWCTLLHITDTSFSRVKMCFRSCAGTNESIGHHSTHWSIDTGGWDDHIVRFKNGDDVAASIHERNHVYSQCIGLCGKWPVGVCVADLLAYSTVKPILTSILRYATELNTHATS